jgi:hypothetical protein
MDAVSRYEFCLEYAMLGIPGYDGHVMLVPAIIDLQRCFTYMSMDRHIESTG